jgi:hypothetical protein
MTARTRAEGTKPLASPSLDPEAKLAAAKAVIASQAKLLSDMSRKLEALETNLDTIKAEKEVLEEEVEVPAVLRCSVFAGGRRSMMFPPHVARPGAGLQADINADVVEQSAVMGSKLKFQDSPQMSAYSAPGPSLMLRSPEAVNEEDGILHPRARCPSFTTKSERTSCDPDNAGSLALKAPKSSISSQRGTRISLLLTPTVDANMAAVAEALGTLSALISFQSPHVQEAPGGRGLLLHPEGVAEVCFLVSGISFKS